MAPNLLVLSCHQQLLENKHEKFTISKRFNLYTRCNGT